MHDIIEYWSRDFEIAFAWRRNPFFEGAIGEKSRDPPGVVSAVMAAVADGATKLRIAARAGRTATGLRVASPRRLQSTAGSRGLSGELCGHGALDVRGLVPVVDLGVWPDGHRMSLVVFDRMDQVDLGAFGAVVILSGPPVGDLKQARDMAARLSADRFHGLRVGLVLSHSRLLLAAPDRLIDVATLQA